MTRFTFGPAHAG